MTTSDLAPQDAELIAAFIDRRMPKEERQAFLERLDSEEALYEVFVETVRYRDEATGRDNVVKHPAWRKKWTLPAAIAALLALTVAAPLLIRSLSDPPYAELLVAERRLDQHLVEGWYDQEWYTPRGVMSDRDIPFRIGVRVVDLKVALVAGRLEDARDLILLVDALLTELEVSEHVRAPYGQLWVKIEEGIADREAVELADSAESSLGGVLTELRQEFDLGKWAEVGRLAARSGNGDVLLSRSFRHQLNVFRREKQSVAVATHLDSIADMLAMPLEPLDYQRVEGSLASIIRGN